MYNECDKHQRVYARGLLIHRYSRLQQHRSTSHSGLQQTDPLCHNSFMLPSNDLARCQIPTVPLAIYQLVSHNMHGFSCPNSHNKFMAYFKTACLPHPPLFIKNIIIMNVRSDLGIASPGRFAWAWGGLLLRHFLCSSTHRKERTFLVIVIVHRNGRHVC